MEKGTVYFFTGLAGAGKTTIGGLFYRRLKAKKLNVFCMDGDAMDGVFERTRDTLYRRDQKKLYSSGAKEVVGVDLPWEEPKTPDAVVENDGQETPEAIVARLERRFGLSQ